MIASVIVASVEYCIIFIIWQVAFRAKAMQYHPDQNQNNKGELTLLVSDHLLFRKKKKLCLLSYWFLFLQRLQKQNLKK